MKLLKKTVLLLSDENLPHISYIKKYIRLNLINAINACLDYIMQFTDLIILYNTLSVHT